MSRALTTVVAAAAVSAALAAAPQAYARASSLGQRHAATSDVFSRADVAMVLGARVWPDGRPSRALRQRVATAAQLYHRGLVGRLLLTGAGHNKEGLDEPASMARAALELGVPEEALLIDGSGHDTRASARNAREALGVASLIVCTQEFHLPRAMWLCRSVGLEVQGAFPPILRHRHTAVGYVREIPATWKAALEIGRDAVSDSARRRP